MSMWDSRSFLRHVLLADGIVSGGTGLLLAAGAPIAGPVLGLTSGLLIGGGAFLVAFGAALVLAARKGSPSPEFARGVVGVNIAWVAASIAFALLGPASVTALGTAFVVLQAVVVGVLAELQIMGLRRLGAVASPA